MRCVVKPNRSSTPCSGIPEALGQGRSDEFVARSGAKDEIVTRNPHLRPPGGYLSKQHLEVLVSAAVEVFHGEAVLVAPRRQVDGVRLHIGEIEQWNRGNEPAESEAGPVLGLRNVASFRERPV